MVGHSIQEGLSPTLSVLFTSRWNRSSRGEPKLSICEKNLAFMWVCGNSRIQLGIVPLSGSPALPESSLGEYNIGCLAKKASTDRRSFEANKGPTSQGSR